MRNWLKTLRENRGLSQDKLANALGINRVYYNMIENGKRQADMSLSLMQKIADFFELSLDDIAELEKE